MGFYRARYKPIAKDKIIKQVFADEEKIKPLDVIAEYDDYYICYSAFYARSYKVRKSDRIYESRDEIKYVRWARRLHAKKSGARKKFLENTKMRDFRDRYISDFPEYMI